jgi:hypothetical protein
MMYNNGRRAAVLLQLRLKLMADELAKRSAAEPADADFARAAREVTTVYERILNTYQGYVAAEANLKTARWELDRDYLFCNGELQRWAAWAQGRFGVYDAKSLKSFGLNIDGRRRKLARRMGTLPADEEAPTGSALNPHGKKKSE